MALHVHASKRMFCIVIYKYKQARPLSQIDGASNDAVDFCVNYCEKISNPIIQRGERQSFRWPDVSNWSWETCWAVLSFFRMLKFLSSSLCHQILT